MVGDNHARPKARDGLLAADHSKRGRRFVTLLDRESGDVTLLEPWEHAILVLCDGTRGIGELVDILPPDDDGQPMDEEVVRRCLKYFERQSLIEDVGLRESDEQPPGPRTLAQIQLAYNEWHKEPAKTGQFESWEAPSFVGDASPFPSGLGPTVALPGRAGTQAHRNPVGIGSTLVLAGAESVLIDGTGDGPDEPSAAANKDAQAHAVLEALDLGPVGTGLDTVDSLDVLSAIDEAVSEIAAESQERLNPDSDALLQNPNVQSEPARSRVRADASTGSAGHDFAETIAAVPRFEERTSRLQFPESESTDVRAPAERALSAVKPVDYGPDDEQDMTDHGILVRRVPEPRVRTIDTGPKRAPTAGRDLFERLAALGSAADRRAGRRNAATVEEVIGDLDDDELDHAARHFRELRTRLPNSRATVAVARMIGSVADPRGESRSDGPSRAARTAFQSALSAVVAEASAKGRCPACLARANAGFRRCGACGYQPPRRR